MEFKQIDEESESYQRLLKRIEKFDIYKENIKDYFDNEGDYEKFTKFN